MKCMRLKINLVTYFRHTKQNRVEKAGNADMCKIINCGKCQQNYRPVTKLSYAFSVLTSTYRKIVRVNKIALLMYGVLLGCAVCKIETSKLNTEPHYK